MKEAALAATRNDHWELHVGGWQPPTQRPKRGPGQSPGHTLPFPAPGQIDGAQVADGLDGVGGRGALLAEIVPSGSSVHGDLAHVRLQIQVIVGAWQGGFQGQGAQVALEAVIPGQAALYVDIPHIGHGLQAVAA